MSITSSQLKDMFRSCGGDWDNMTFEINLYIKQWALENLVVKEDKKEYPRATPSLIGWQKGYNYVRQELIEKINKIFG